MKNPYHYGTPVEGEQFTGREEELGALLTRMRDGINVVLISPRRYGKTSLLRKAEAVLRAEDAAVVSVNVMRCVGVAALAEQLASGAYGVPGGRWRQAKQAVPSFLKRLRVAPSVTFDRDGRPTFSLSPGISGTDAEQVIADVYGLLADIPSRRPRVLVLDEFQAAGDLDPHLPSLFKALADDHPRVSLVLAGSKQHLMEQIVLGPDAPLYGISEHIALAPLPPDVMERYLVKRARAGRKHMTPDTAAHIVAVAGPVPNDIQQLAYAAYEAADTEIDRPVVDRAFDMVVAHNAAVHADRFEALATGQRRVISGLAEETTSQPFSAAFAARAGMTSVASVQAALKALVDAGLVAQRGEVWEVTDPFFAGWLRSAV